MDEPELFKPSPAVAAALAPPKGVRAHTLVYAWRLAAIVLWLYVVTKLLIFDADNYLVDRYAPEYKWLIEFKLFVILGIVGLVAALFRKWRVIGFIAYVIFFPLIVIFWLVPYLAFKSKSWVLSIAMLSIILRLFVTFKVSSMMIGMLSVGVLLILVSPSMYTILVGIVVLAVFQVVLYIMSARALFTTDPVFRAYQNVFSWVSRHTISTNSLGSELLAVPTAEMSSAQLESRKSKLEVTVLSNRLFLFVSDKLRLYSEANTNIVGGIVKCFVLFSLSVFVFALLNFGIFRIDATQFKIVSEASFFEYTYYSFRVFILQSIDNIIPVKPLSKSLQMIEYLFGLFTTAIFLGVVFSRHKERQSKAIKDAIGSIEKNARELENFLLSEFRFKTVDEAIVELERLKAGMIGLVLWLSKSSK